MTESVNVKALFSHVYSHAAQHKLFRKSVSVAFAATMVATLLQVVFTNNVYAQSPEPQIASSLVVPTQMASSLVVPTNGMSKSQVRAQLGDPVNMDAPVGRPPITRWHYEGMTVFFENDLVIIALSQPGATQSESNNAPVMRSTAATAPIAPLTPVEPTNDWTRAQQKESRLSETSSTVATSQGEARAVKVSTTPQMSDGERSLSDTGSQMRTEAMPLNAMSMQQVLATFGEPQSTTHPVGKPAITVWHYPFYKVFFEEQLVLISLPHVEGSQAPGKRTVVQDSVDVPAGGTVTDQ